MRTVLAFVHACTDKLSEKISNKECKWDCCFLNENRQGLFLEKKKEKKEKKRLLLKKIKLLNLMSRMEGIKII